MHENKKKKSYMLMLLQPNALPTELRRVNFTLKK